MMSHTSNAKIFKLREIVEEKIYIFSTKKKFIFKYMQY